MAGNILQFKHRPVIARRRRGARNVEHGYAGCRGNRKSVFAVRRVDGGVHHRHRRAGPVLRAKIVCGETEGFHGNQAAVTHAGKLPTVHNDELGSTADAATLL